MTIHANSRESFHGFDHDSREAAVLRIFHANQQLGFTDRQIAEFLRFEDMNAVRPTITRLTDLGRLEGIASIQCLTTHRNVRRSRWCVDPSKARKPTMRSIPMTKEIRMALGSLMAKHPNHTQVQIVHWALVQALKENA